MRGRGERERERALDCHSLRVFRGLTPVTYGSPINSRSQLDRGPAYCPPLTPLHAPGTPKGSPRVTHAPRDNDGQRDDKRRR